MNPDKAAVPVAMANTARADSEAAIHHSDVQVVKAACSLGNGDHH
jgi:hypothetical protein